MKNFLHIIFIFFVIFLMIVCIIPAILIYMFTDYNFITTLQVEASKFENRYFTNGQ
jgi:hypothetical protein